MYYIGNAVKRVADFYNQINSATLTGAIDIVVIKHEDGSFVGSPFHVRFGKLGVLSSSEKVVEIAINDVEVDLQMKLGAAGEAFFVECVSMQEHIPENLATSPIPSQMDFMTNNFQFMEGSEVDMVDEDDDKNEDFHEHSTVTRAMLTSKLNWQTESSQMSVSKTIPIPQKSKSMLYNNSHMLMSKPFIHELQSNYPLSDMDSPISTPICGSPTDKEPIRQVYSDTEIEVGEFNEIANSDITWEWGMLPKSPAFPKTPKDGKSSESQRRKSDRKWKQASVLKQANVLNKSSSEGLLLDEVLAADKEVADLYLNSPPEDGNLKRESTPISMIDDHVKDDDTLPLPDNDNGVPVDVSISLCGGLKNRKVEPDKFLDSLVTFEKFCENPNILLDPNLVIRINNRYYNWMVAAPYLMSHIVYQRTIPQDSLKLLKRKYMPRKRRGWFSWNAPQEELESSDEEKGGRGYKGSDPDDVDSDGGQSNPAAGEEILSDGLEYKKTLRLTSTQWKSLNLNYGANKVTFTVTTRYQGTATCDARIFLWTCTDKIVISDIDGTITRSDVLGQILPVVGKDWFQTDVAGLFSKIAKNGYHLMYLSARPIGQAGLTREILKSVKQGERTLPDGPVFLTPTSLLLAFKKEVIEKKPEEFKISCMRDIQSLFPTSSDPFHSGFGNRINDVWAYRAVGIPISRIFTINYKGELKHELTKVFSSSYGKLMDLVDQMFPFVNSWKVFDSTRSDYTSFNYWRTPIPDLSQTTVDDEDFEFP